MRFSPQRRAIFRHCNFEKCSENVVFCTVSLENVLLATAACNFSTSQLQKVVRTWHVLYIFTWKCASRHSGVQFFNISTSKSGPNLTCFVHFHLKMCFSPQRRTIFRHLNFKKWSEADVFCTFSLENVLLATAACNFSTSQLQKVVRTWRVLYIFTWKCASRHSGVQFLISPLTTWLCTRRFNEPTFRLTRHTNHWKNTAFRDFSNIWRGWIFFLLTFALLHLLSSDFTSSHLLFICFSTLHIVGSLLFKLPSNIITVFQFIISPEWYFPNTKQAQWYQDSFLRSLTLCFCKLVSNFAEFTSYSMQQHHVLVTKDMLSFHQFSPHLENTLLPLLWETSITWKWPTDCTIYFTLRKDVWQLLVFFPWASRIWTKVPHRFLQMGIRFTAAVN